MSWTWFGCLTRAVYVSRQRFATKKYVDHQKLRMQSCRFRLARNDAREDEGHLTAGWDDALTEIMIPRGRPNNRSMRYVRSPNKD